MAGCPNRQVGIANDIGNHTALITLTFLGTGTSTGIPVIGCDCAVCHSPDPRDNRLRASVHLDVDGTSILIDTSPDLRQQMLRANVRHLDAVIYTHMHADHTAGLDELRRYNIMQQQWIPVWAEASTGAELEERFAYAFARQFPFFGGKPDLELNVFAEPFTVNGVEVTPLPVHHGSLPIVGYRIGNFAYITDQKVLPEETFALLEGVDTLVLTALREQDHPAHMTLAEALATIERIAPRQAYLSHLGHEMGRHAEVEPTLPDGVNIAVDGAVVKIA